MKDEKLPKKYESIEDSTEDPLQICENNSNYVGIYTYYDTEADRYDTPFYCQTDLMARRNHEIILKRNESMIAMMPEKFQLHRIGFFDHKEGCLIEIAEEITL